MTEKHPSTVRDVETTAVDERTQRAVVRDRYDRIARTDGSCCGDTGSCCGSSTDQRSENVQPESDGEVTPQTEPPNLGCGDPTAIVDLQPGETVVDLGSGGGRDCFLAAEAVGPTGQVIGVDMTAEMIETARRRATETDVSNVEFRLGEIEHLPVADGSVDVLLSNCVVNLSPAKQQVFHEAYRVLQPGGRLAIADIVLKRELPARLRTDPTSVAACIGGAAPIPALEEMLTMAGFTDPAIEPIATNGTECQNCYDDVDLHEHLVAARITAKKPATATTTQET